VRAAWSLQEGDGGGGGVKELSGMVWPVIDLEGHLVDMGNYL